MDSLLTVVVKDASENNAQGAARIAPGKMSKTRH